MWLLIELGANLPSLFLSLSTSGSLYDEILSLLACGSEFLKYNEFVLMWNVPRKAGLPQRLDLTVLLQKQSASRNWLDIVNQLHFNWKEIIIKKSEKKKTQIKCRASSTSRLTLSPTCLFVILTYPRRSAGTCGHAHTHNLLHWSFSSLTPF